MNTDNLYPIPVDVEEDKIYQWCGCGESKTQPFCDKKDCGDKSVTYTAPFSDTIYFCACKQTNDPPFCDGSHAKLMMDILKKRKDK